MGLGFGVMGVLGGVGGLGFWGVWGLTQGFCGRCRGSQNRVFLWCLAVWFRAESSEDEGQISCGDLTYALTKPHAWRFHGQL